MQVTVCRDPRAQAMALEVLLHGCGAWPNEPRLCRRMGGQGQRKGEGSALRILIYVGKPSQDFLDLSTSTTETRITINNSDLPFVGDHHCHDVRFTRHARHCPDGCLSAHCTTCHPPDVAQPSLSSTHGMVADHISFSEYALVVVGNVGFTDCQQCVLEPAHY